MRSLLSVIVAHVLLACTSVAVVSDISAGTIDYRQEMRAFVQGISEYAKNSSVGFVVIPQNGVELISTTGEATGAPARDYLRSIDGVGQESLFYGYYADGVKSPESETHRISALLDMARREGGVAVLVSDYCLTHVCMDHSLRRNKAKGYVSFSAEYRELNNIPDYPPVIDANRTPVTRLSEVKNFLYLINPDSFANRQALVDAVAGTEFDLVILDFFFRGEAFTRQQVEQLKLKSNGAKRLLLSYLSIGEAEDYRYYWSELWKESPPAWLREQNPVWEGNYYVEYWNPDWQRIIYGDDSAYLDKILDAGFDGVYLDIIDAFEFFEKQ